MRRISHLPGRADGSEGLISMADKLGAETVFNLIRRCRTAQGPGNDPAGDTLTILAHRMVDAAWKAAGPNRVRAQADDGNIRAARKAVAAQLGYDDRNRPNFNRIFDRTLTTDGDDELLTLARHHGDAAAYDFILLCRTARGAGQDAGREALTTLANRMVNAEMERAAVDSLTARQRVATRLGYTAKVDGHTRTNFTKILTTGRTPDRRPSSRYRGSGKTRPDSESSPRKDG